MEVICIGLNYADHAKESEMTEPLEPVVFLKSTTAIVGPNDDLIIPKDSNKTDWDVELGVVIGKRASVMSTVIFRVIYLTSWQKRHEEV